MWLSAEYWGVVALTVCDDPGVQLNVAGVVIAGDWLSTTSDSPDGEEAMVTAVGFGEKLAVTLRYPFIVTLAVLPDELSTPDHDPNVYPPLALAVKETVWPGLYQGPAGLGVIVPPAGGEDAVFRRYLVEYVAV